MIILRSRVSVRDGIPALLLSIVLLWTLAACDRSSVETQALLPDLPPTETEAWIENGGVSDFLVRTYGEDAGPRSFGLITAVAVRADGRLAVADLFSCEIVLIDRSEGSVMNRFGGCGGGPGEFQRIRALAAHGDSLIVYDQGHNSISVLDNEGTELSRVIVALAQEGGGGLAYVSAMDDSTVVVSLERASDAFVGVLDIRSGELRTRLIGEPPIAREGPQNTIRRTPSCASTTQGRPVAVVKNSWAFEGAGFVLPEPQVKFHFVSSVPIEPLRRNDGSWAIPGVVSGIACGASNALFKMTRTGPLEEGRRQPDVTYLESRTFDGAPSWRMTVTDPHSLLHGSLGPIIGDTVFVFSNTLHSYPVVAEFVLQQTEAL